MITLKMWEWRRVALLGAMSFVLMLIWRMAQNSPINAHPDEAIHIACAHYYVEHWLPPTIGEVRDAYSVYGMSNLDDYHPAYFFQGKFAALLSLIGLSQELGMRLFQLCLWLTWMVFVGRASGYFGLFALTLVSPQIWYVFSYVNNDAFPLFLMWMLAYQLAERQSLFWRYVEQEQVNVVALGVLSAIWALLLLSKFNYLAFSGFAFLYCCYLCFFEKAVRRLWFKRMALMAGGALFFVGMRVGYDRSTNGWQRDLVRANYAEHIAGEGFRPSQIGLPESFSTLALKARGEPLVSIFLERHWHLRTFRSFVGLYGFMNVEGPKWYYKVMRYLYVIGASAWVLTLLLLGGARERGVLLVSSLCVVATIGLSAYYAWVSDFQPQGRYLFPIVGMVMPVVDVLPNHRFIFGFRVLWGVLFMLSAGSFIWVALVGLYF